MFRLFLSLQACCLVAALAQPSDARDSLIRPTNPPQPLSPQSVTPQSVTPQNLPGENSGPALLKITKAELEEDITGSKKLKVTISDASSGNLEMSKMTVMTYFYEKDASGQLELTTSQLVPDWTSPPVDWNDGHEEELILSYGGPPADSGKTYAGYVLGVYYQDRLQDSRASAPELLKKLPQNTAFQDSPPIPSGPNSPSSAAPDRFLQAYKAFQEAEQAFERGDRDAAKKSVQSALSHLTSIHRENPDWQPLIVEYRIAKAKLLETKIDAK